MKIYLVGGAIRDRLLGRAVAERDWVVVGATAQEMERRGFRVKAPDFPVYLHPESGEEYALARRESKCGSGYKGFKFDTSTSITIEEDLARRDLTINAIAQSQSGEIVDPFHGCSDLQSRCLRHVTPAFTEDPLRVLRLARFHAQLGEFNFRISAQTESLALQMCAGDELLALSAGRVWGETARALAAPSPVAFFDALIRWGALAQLLPWLHVAAEHDLTGSMAALTRVGAQSKDPNVRLATLLVSIALRSGTPIDIPRHWPIPAAVRTLCMLGVDHPLPATADAETILNWLESVDAWRRTDRFSDLSQVWRAVAPEANGLLRRLGQYRDISRRVPPPAAGIDPRAAVRSYRLKQIAQALKETPRG